MITIERSMAASNGVKVKRSKIVLISPVSKRVILTESIVLI